MREIGLKLVLALGMQMINAGAIYGAVLHMKSTQLGGATSSETLLVVAGLFLLAKGNFMVSKIMRKPLTLQSTVAVKNVA